MMRAYGTPGLTGRAAQSAFSRLTGAVAASLAIGALSP